MKLGKVSLNNIIHYPVVLVRIDLFAHSSNTIERWITIPSIEMACVINENYVVLFLI